MPADEETNWPISLQLMVFWALREPYHHFSRHFFRSTREGADRPHPTSRLFSEHPLDPRCSAVLVPCRTLASAGQLGPAAPSVRTPPPDGSGSSELAALLTASEAAAHAYAASERRCTERVPARLAPPRSRRARLLFAQPVCGQLTFVRAGDVAIFTSHSVTALHRGVDTRAELCASAGRVMTSSGRVMPGGGAPRPVLGAGWFVSSRRRPTAPGRPQNRRVTAANQRAAPT